MIFRCLTLLVTQVASPLLGDLHWASGSSSLRSLAYSVLGTLIFAGLGSEATDGGFCDVVGLRL